MPEYTERAAAAKVFEELLESPFADGRTIYGSGVRDALKLSRDIMLNRVPYNMSIPSSSNVCSRKHGKWVEVKSSIQSECIGKHRCSVCNGSSTRDWVSHEEILSDYCPHCGSIMDS